MEEQAERFEIRFEGVSVAEASTNAAKLRRELNGVSPQASANIIKDDPTNQDLGATVVLVLGTSAVTAIAKGIASFLSRSRAKISITICADGSKVVVGEGLSGDDAARIAEAMFKGKK